MTRPERRAELAALRAAEAAAQERREAACPHLDCRVTRTDWHGRPLTMIDKDP